MSVIKYNNKKFSVELKDDADESVMREIFEYGEYKMAEYIIRDAKYPIVDVGAHIGLFAIYCRAINDDVEVYCLEPEHNNVKKMTRNLQENDIENVFVSQMALSRSSGDRKLVLTPDFHNYHLATKDVSGERVVMVKTIDFASFCRRNGLSRISLVKMDIEGGEYEILENMTPDDFAMIDNLVMEYHDGVEKKHSILEGILKKAGYIVESCPSKFEKGLGFIFARREA